MRKPLSLAIVVALGLVGGALILRRANAVEAACATGQVGTIRLAFNPGDTQVLGTVPANHRLVLHDFMAWSGGGTFEVLGNGVPLVPPMRIGSNSVDSDLIFSFATGIPVPAGTLLSIHRVNNNCCASELHVGLVFE